MRKIYAALLIGTMTLNSCVTIFTPRKQDFTVNTDNPKATISVDGEIAGTGNTVQTKINRDFKAKQIKIEAPDRKTTYYAILPSKTNPLVYLGCFTYYGYYIDLANKKTYSYSKILEANSGKKKQIRQSTDKYIDVDEVKFDIKDKDFKFINIPYNNYLSKIDKIENNEKKAKNVVTNTKDIKVDNTIFSGQLSKVLKKYGYIDTVNQIFKDQANSLELRANVKTVTFYNVYTTNSIWQGNFYICKSDIAWDVVNTYGEILKSVTVRSQSGEFVSSEKIEEMVGDMIENSLDQVLSNGASASLLKIESKAETKLAATTLTKPSAFVTTATDVQPATVIVKTEKGHGSGFAVSNDGYLITNYHVIASEDPAKQRDLTVILNDGTKLKATVVKFNKDRDVALLKVDSKFEKCFDIPSTKSFTALEEVFAMGAPKSIELGQTASKGIISSERNINNVSLIQTNISINAGNSGGPMFNKDGKLYGVVTSKLFGIGVEGIAFCIPAYKIKDYLNIDFK